MKHWSACEYFYLWRKMMSFWEFFFETKLIMRATSRKTWHMQIRNNWRESCHLIQLSYTVLLWNPGEEMKKFFFWILKTLNFYSFFTKLSTSNFVSEYRFGIATKQTFYCHVQICRKNSTRSRVAVTSWALPGWLFKSIDRIDDTWELCWVHWDA